jgi:hypothetical protein
MEHEGDNLFPASAEPIEIYFLRNVNSFDWTPNLKLANEVNPIGVTRKC